jgi:nitrite reductase (NO-forming)
MSPLAKMFALVGAFVAVSIGVVALIVSAASSQRAEESAAQAVEQAAAIEPVPSTEHVHQSATTMESFAAAAPTGVDPLELAAKHKAAPADVPAIPEGDVVTVPLTLKDVTIEIAPGVQYRAWGFEGGAPGPAIHVREGQTVKIVLRNGGAIPHSVDFHAARIAPNVAFRDVNPGESLSYTFEAKDPGVFMYHCGTKPVLAHIANGMYGAIVVEPANPLPKADKEFVLVSSEWYLNNDGVTEPASFNADKARAVQPDWVTWNGYANQYVTHPLRADPGDLVRFWMVAAGPSLDTDFHVVGTILDRAYVNADMTQFQRRVQTVGVPAGGGAAFDIRIDEPGLYPFVSHSFASVDQGQVGLLNVGHVEGSMSH